VVSEQRTDAAGGGLRIGRIFGVPIYVAPTWFLVAALITWFYAPTVEGAVPGLGPWRYAVSLSFAVLLYLSVLVHEASHTAVAVAFGLPVRRISLHLLGGVSEIEREPETPGRDFLVAVAGPVLSLALAVVGWAASRALPDGSVLHLLAILLAVSNLLVGVFNLLPGLPLDGGRMLRAAVWKATGRPFSGTLAAAWVGRVIAITLLAVPLALSVAIPGFSVGLVEMVWAALIASFIWVGAGQAIASGRFRERLPALGARGMARRAVGVLADTPLAEALRRANEADARAILVVSGDGKPQGLVSEAAVMAVPEPRRPWVAVSTVTRELRPELVLPVDLSGPDLIAALRRTPAGEYLVLDAGGAVHGVLSAADIRRAVGA